MKWYIEQRIVAIRDHSMGVFKKGDEFTIKGLMEAKCKCSHLVIDVGILTYSQHLDCRICKAENMPNPSKVWWFAEICFAPIGGKSELSEHTPEELIAYLDRPLSWREAVRNIPYHRNPPLTGAIATEVK